ncbi:hypothetical protein GCM10009839_51470 [Catenulispora yoronensis]|uniref:Uncharacterized protein n=1 Tax=Catenulispora yoronensis TaxID=450799 RepID=A0ABP5GBY4_9ACTN
MPSPVPATNAASSACPKGHIPSPLAALIWPARPTLTKPAFQMTVSWRAVSGSQYGSSSLLTTSVGVVSLVCTTGTKLAASVRGNRAEATDGGATRNAPRTPGRGSPSQAAVARQPRLWATRTRSSPACRTVSAARSSAAHQSSRSGLSQDSGRMRIAPSPQARCHLSCQWSGPEPPYPGMIT